MAAIQFSSAIESNGTGSMNATVETVPCAAERTVAPSFKQSRFRQQPLNRREPDKTGVKASKSPDELGWQLSRAELYRTMIREKAGIWLKSMTTKLRSGLEGSTKSLLAVMLLVFGFQTVEAREIPKVNGQINEIYEDQFGRVFVIGEFTSVGETPARNIAVWKNGHWYSLGSGTDGVINDIEVTPGGGVVIVGEFRTAGGAWVNHIALWNGQSWEAVGLGTNRKIQKLQLGNDGALLVFGEFTLAGGEIAHSMAVWKGRWLTEKQANKVFLGETEEKTRHYTGNRTTHTAKTQYFRETLD